MMLMVKAMQIKVGNPLRKLVLLKLADNASDQGECWPSYQYIADQCEISKRSVMSHIDDLCQSGLLKKVFRKGPKGNSTNIYILTLPSAGDSLPSAGDSLPSAGDSLPSAGDSLGGSAGAAPRISHSFEPVNEPNSLSGREGFMSEAAKRRIGISPGGEIPLPPMFKPSEEHIAMAREKGVSIETELLNFKDYHTARGTMLLDWNSAFRVWIRNARVNPLASKRSRSEPETPHWNSREGWEDFL
ncbi:TPA: helix-turn-helix domain-containing protein [Enterobacter hormaechei]|uniref:helix-turn-helix domain-containing protein n=1 Tax=Enterobacter hormaechei TaxID=158836 RepID=UPI000DCCD662|nr:helix-turn-helix domain-containing protein [Enterobacter hormaechei]QLN96640.1 helix-turn-helix domain-containing protein [Enterobacter hormaechei]QLV08618.1 helix-turn-helix domain-containing protein [Enterobacter hormaechei]QLV13103.1 helix-turn-helix domain-containing protein [Enterobacter hormaechei]RAY63981.1 helix-turn-helix domain-containing protein [Enterobacter hormaechei subsp. oharae]HAS0865510.1 helix-turn-helix domain-containing protein [Enterobacter hormaechei subsp. oharae]